MTDANGLSDRGELLLRVLPERLRVMSPDEHTVVLYDWQGPDGRLFEERVGRDPTMTLTYTNTGGDHRHPWPGREGRFPLDTGHGEHGVRQHRQGVGLATEGQGRIRIGSGAGPEDVPPGVDGGSGGYAAVAHGRASATSP